MWIQLGGGHPTTAVIPNAQLRIRGPAPQVGKCRPEAHPE
jgi:hypothetical protein